MRKTALVLSLCGGGATLIAALLLAMQAIPNHMHLWAIGGEVLLGLACTAAVALATRNPTLAAVLQLTLALLLFGLAPNIQTGVAWLPATALFIASAALVFFSVPHRDWSLFGVARAVGTLLAGFFLVMGISELAEGLGPTGHFFADLIRFWPTYPLVIGPLLGWLGGRWVAVGGVLLIGEYGYWIGLALWSGDPGGAGGWGVTLLFIGLWLLVGVVYVWEWWRHRPQREMRASTSVPDAATR